jgi:hypothetical protein
MRLLHLKTEAIAHRLLLYGDITSHRVSLINFKATPSKEKVGMPIDLWADRWQAVCATAPPMSRRF